MIKDPYSKLESSLSLEELLAQSGTRNPPNWLLTYLDVFVLIVMLVITLITLSDINTQNQAIANIPKATPTCPKILPPITATCPPINIADTKPLQPIEPTQQAAKIKPDNENINIEPQKSQTDDKATTRPPETQSATPIAKAVPLASSAEENTLQQQLTKTIDDFGLKKTVNIKVHHGYAELAIQDNVLFKSSESKLTSSGEALIKRLIPLLKQAVGLILIEGHTDNIPIKTAQFPSNWELGSSRATSVLHFLVSQHLDSSHLRAITYADTMPIADNSTAEGREKNRRVNLLIKFPEP